MKSFLNTNKNLVFLEGFGYSFGVLINPLVEFYGSDVTTISWASSIYNGSVFMFGPIVGGFAKKYGLRPICISGGIVSCFGLCISTLSPYVSVLIITVGVIGGFGASLVFIPANVAIGYYFESKRALATGITHCGSGVGQFFLAPFITFLSNTYSWKIVILIIGGFCLTCAIFGALIQPLEVVSDRNSVSAPNFGRNYRFRYQYRSRNFFFQNRNFFFFQNFSNFSMYFHYLGEYKFLKT